MSERGRTIQILTGEAMWPDRVNARWPGAQFVARARFDAGDAQRPLAFQSLDAPAIWGVLIAFPDDSATGVPVETTTDLGERITAYFEPNELLAIRSYDKVFVDDWGQCRSGRFGALRAHVDQGLVTGDTIAGELADVVAGTRPGRERDDERILFWHRGLATTDIALGQAILDRAVEQGDRHAPALPMILLERPDQLDAGSYRRIVLEHEAVAVAPALLDAVDAERGRMLAHLATGATAYGVNTGLGYMAGTPIEPAEQRAFQRSILLRGAGQGPPFAPEVVRGAMLIRLAGFLNGRAGVSAALCGFIADRLNDGWAPLGAVARDHERRRGDRAQPSLPDPRRRGRRARGRRGRGRARTRSRAVACALRARAQGGHRARQRRAAGAGAGRMAGRPLPRAARSRDARRALTAALAGGSLRPYSARIGRLKGDPGQAAGARAAGAAARRAPPTGATGPRLPSPSASCRRSTAPSHDLVDRIEEQVARELRAVTDSPLYLGADGDEPEGFYPSGNFHAQALSFELDALAIGFAQVGNLSEKRLHRLLDSRFSGLRDQLACDPGRQTGLVFAHKSVLGFAAENRLLAAPASVLAIDSSAGQEDFQAFTFLAAEQLGRLLDNLELILAAELVAIRQARHLRAADAAAAAARRRAARGRPRRAGRRGPVAERRLRARARPDPVRDAPRRRSRRPCEDSVAPHVALGLRRVDTLVGPWDNASSR